METICFIDEAGVYLFHREFDDENGRIPTNAVLSDPPENLDVINVWRGFWHEVDERPAPQGEPVRISRIDLRRLLKAKEAQWFDEAEAKSEPLTPAEREEVFDLNSANIELQYKAALRDALLQWRLLDQGVIELDHPDTALFLGVLGMNGMFGDEAETRIPQILAQQPPGA